MRLFVSPPSSHFSGSIPPETTNESVYIGVHSWFIPGLGGFRSEMIFEDPTGWGAQLIFSFTGASECGIVSQIGAFGEKKMHTLNAVPSHSQIHFLPGIFRRRTILSLFVLMMFLASCSKNEYVIPKQPDVRKQYEFAVIQEKKFRSPFRGSTRRADFDQAIAAFEKVITSYPLDPVYTPRSRLQIAMIRDTAGQKRKALDTYETLLKQYPSDDVIQISALYGAAVIYDGKKQYEKAQNYFDQILKRYGDRKEPMFSEVVRKTRIHTQQVRKR